MPPSQTVLTSKSYAATRFSVSIDHHDITAFVKNVEGGLIKSDPVVEQAGASNIPLKHTSTRSIEPVSLEVGMCNSNWILDRVTELINQRKHTRFSGQIDYADPNSKSRFRQEFTRAIISEVALPAFDANSKDFAFLKIKLQPETSTFGAQGGGEDIKSDPFSALKLWQTSAFSFDLEVNGRKLFGKYVTKVEAMTFKVGAKAVNQGPHTLPTYMPTKIEIPKISVHIPLQYATEAINWYRDSIADTVGRTEDGGKVGSGYEATGGLTVLDPSRQKQLYYIEMSGIGPESMSLVKAEGGNTTMKSVKFDLYCTTMKLNAK